MDATRNEQDNAEGGQNGSAPFRVPLARPCRRAQVPVRLNSLGHVVHLGLSADPRKSCIGEIMLAFL